MACPKIACECHPGGRRMRKLGERVLLWGDSYAATDTAAFLADIGKDLTIVTENREFAADCEVIHMYVLRKRFEQGDAEVLESRPYKHRSRSSPAPRSSPSRATRWSSVTQDFRRTTIEVDDIVTCHTRPVTELFEELRAAVCPSSTSATRSAPRNLYQAVKEGSDFGLAVDEHLLFNSNQRHPQRAAHGRPRPAHPRGRSGLHRPAHGGAGPGFQGVALRGLFPFVGILPPVPAPARDGR